MRPDIVTTLTTTNRPDPRLHAWREDLAASGLRYRVQAPRYADGEQRRVVRATLPLLNKPGVERGLDNEVLFGERVTVFDVDGGWAWVQLARDGYVGYVQADGLADPGPEPTHRVRAIGTFLYAAADIKSQPLASLPLNAELAVVGTEDNFLRLAGGGYVVARHIAERGRNARDFVEVAERFIDTPYLWGGRTRLGLDCSGLVQVAMEAAGLACPRDSDMQQQSVGTEVLVPADLDGLKRGDLVFWRGHVGIMTDGIMLLHANAHHMAVVAEPLPQAASRIARTGVSIATVRRPAGLTAS
jgi:cell wall-associated NlpC family hydrolase